MKRYLLRIFVLLLLLPVAVIAFAQRAGNAAAGDYLHKSWKEVATGMPAEWYGSSQARSAAEIVLQTQKDIGGWAKNTDYHRLPTTEVARLQSRRSEIGATFDNGATIRELRFLARVYSQTGDRRYKQAFIRGLDYIFLSQYDNGGWPQFYPVREGNVAYSGHITYNDGSMVNIMLLLQDICSGNEDFASLDLSQKTRSQAEKAFDLGIDCILNTQIIVEGKPTVWCAQHDEDTFAPADARSYELASFSGSESADIVLLLMSIDDPSKEIARAIEGAVEWLDAHKIEGIRLEVRTDNDGKKDRIVIQDKGAPALWARFYDLETEAPFFCDRDGIKRGSLAEIGHERRNGYSWYTDAPREVIAAYSGWKTGMTD